MPNDIITEVSHWLIHSRAHVTLWYNHLPVARGAGQLLSPWKLKMNSNWPNAHCDRNVDQWDKTSNNLAQKLHITSSDFRLYWLRSFHKLEPHIQRFWLFNMFASSGNNRTLDENNNIKSRSGLHYWWQCMCHIQHSVTQTIIDSTNKRFTAYCRQYKKYVPCTKILRSNTNICVQQISLYVLWHNGQGKRNGHPRPYGPDSMIPWAEERETGCLSVLPWYIDPPPFDVNSITHNWKYYLRMRAGKVLQKTSATKTNQATVFVLQMIRLEIVVSGSRNCSEQALFNIIIGSSSCNAQRRCFGYNLTPEIQNATFCLVW